MAPAHSLNLHERLVAAVAAGESCRKVASVFQASVASSREVAAIITRYRERRRPSDRWQNRPCSLADDRA